MEGPVWWRLTEAGGTLYWDTSDDGTEWTQRATLPTADVGFETTSLVLVVGESAYGELPPEGATAMFDDVNLPPPPP
jgi:hypothetical protein